MEQKQLINDDQIREKIEKYLNESQKLFMDKNNVSYIKIVQILSKFSIKIRLEVIKSYLQKNYPELYPGLEEFYRDSRGDLFDIASFYDAECYTLPLKNNIIALKITPELWRKKIKTKSLRRILELIHPNPSDVHVGCDIGVDYLVVDPKFIETIRGLRNNGLEYKQVCEHVLNFAETLNIRYTYRPYHYEIDFYDLKNIFDVLFFDFNIKSTVTQYRTYIKESERIYWVAMIAKQCLKRHNILCALNDKQNLFKKSLYGRYFDMWQELAAEV